MSEKRVTRQSATFSNILLKYLLIDHDREILYAYYIAIIFFPFFLKKNNVTVNIIFKFYLHRQHC